MLRQGEDDIALVVFQFGELSGVFVDLLQIAGLICIADVGTVVFFDEMLDSGADLGHQFPEIFIEDDADRIRSVAVQIDQGIERTFGQTEKPVDGAFLVPLDVFFIEIFDKVFTDILAQHRFNEIHIGGEIFFAENKGNKVFELGDNIIHKPFFIKYRQNTIPVGVVVASGF